MLRRTILRIEVGLALTLAWGMVFLLPPRLTLRLFGNPQSVLPSDGSQETTASVQARRAANRVVSAARRLPWHSTCLVQAVAGTFLLAVRGIRGSKIRLGVRKGENGLEAHAWLLLGDTILLGGREAANFVALADIGNNRA